MANFTRLKRIFTAVLVLAVSEMSIMLATPSDAHGRSLIRDAEIENIIREYATPVLHAAGLEPKNVRIYLVRDKTLNAFVAGGQRLFVTTGLLKSTEHPGQLTGVLAHEIAHISAGHLARLEGVLRDAQTQALIGTLLGLAVGVLARDPEAAAAGMSLGGHLAMRNLLAYSRVQERSADQAGVRYLDQTKQSARGLMEFLEILENQQLLYVSSKTQFENTYAVTHPLTRDRMAFVQDHVTKSPYSDVPVSAKQRALHSRIVAKLDGFLDPPARTFVKYKAADRSVPARYARAIAYYRLADVKAALKVLNGLISEHPKDPYFWELKGQLLFENGRLDDALPAYDRANELRPNEPLLLVSRAHVQIELNKPELVKPALKTLKNALREDPNLPFAWRLAATAYGRLGEMGMAYLSSAEYNLARRDTKAARGFAARAKKALKRGSAGWLRAEDILHSVRKRKKRDQTPERRKRG